MRAPALLALWVCLLVIAPAAAAPVDVETGAIADLVDVDLETDGIAQPPGTPDPASPGALRWQEALHPAGSTDGAAPRQTARRTPRTAWGPALGLALSLLGLGLLAVRHRLPAGRRPRARLVADLGLGVLGLAGLLAFLGLGLRSLDRPTHLWDSFHYFVGPRYFAELGYDGLYDCVAVADATDTQGKTRRPDVAARRLMDLHRNRVISAKRILSHPERCTDRFAGAPERWASFMADVRWFRERMSPLAWERMQLDHGFNATPAWMLIGTLATGRPEHGPPDAEMLRRLNALDPLLLLAGFGALIWAFGWRVAAVALIVLGGNQAAPAAWTGGSILRWDWLAWLLLGASLLKKGHEGAGGAALAVSALLRVFPGLVFVGPLVLWFTRREPAAGRVLRGAVLAVGLLVPASVAVTGAQAWPACVANLTKHVSVPSANRVGLRTLLDWDRPSVKAERPPGRHVRRFVLGWLRGVSVALALLAVSRLALWEAALLGLALVPVLTEPACYYTMFLLAMAPLAHRRPGVAPALMLVTAITAVAAWRPLTAFSLLALPGQPWGMGVTARIFTLAFLLGSALTVALCLRTPAPDERDA